METIIDNLNLVVKALSDDDTHWIAIELPIVKICGIRVDCMIKVRKFKKHPDAQAQVQLLLFILSVAFYENENVCCGDDKSVLYIEGYNEHDNTLEEKVNQALETIKNLTFNKYIGHFEKRASNKLEWVDAWRELLSDHKHIEFVGGECCVCLCRTKTTTACNHHICYECADKIQVVDEEIPCPMCRQDITYGFN